MDSSIPAPSAIVTIIIEFSETPGYLPFPLAGRSGRVWAYCNFDNDRQKVCTRMTLAEYREAREDLFMVPNRRFYYPLIDVEITRPEPASEIIQSNTTTPDPVATVSATVAVEADISPEAKAKPATPEVVETPTILHKAPRKKQ